MSSLPSSDPAPCAHRPQRGSLVAGIGALLLTLALAYTLGYPVSLTWDLSRYFAFGQIHSLVFAGNAVLVLLVLQWMAQPPFASRRFRFAGAMLVVAHVLTVLTAVFWVPAYTDDHSVQHLGMLVYVLILLLGNFSLMATVPWWTWPRLQLLALIADTLVAMSVVDIGLTVLLPRLVPGWVWTPALTAAVFRLETSIGLAFWYVTVYRRFGAFRHPAVRYWAVGIASMLATDITLLWGTLRLEHGASDLLLGAGMPFWMVHQTMWSVGLFQVLSSEPVWSTRSIARTPRTTRWRWILALRQGLALGGLALVSGIAGSLRATSWFVASLIIGRVASDYELMHERDELTSLNARYEIAQKQLVALNGELVTSNTLLKEMGEHQAYLLEQRQLRAAEVAHDTGNMLQDVKLAHALIRQHYQQQRSPPADIAGSLEVADSSLRFIGDLLTALVAAAQLDAGALELDLSVQEAGSLLSRVVKQQQMRAAELGVTLTLSLPDQPQPLLCDVRLLSRALLNVVSNALKYTGEARNGGSGRVRVGVTTIDTHVYIWVQDNGPGLPREQLARLGQPFVRADGPLRAAAGFGLGLAFTRGVIEQHPGGELSLESTVGEGTVVTMRLSRAIPAIAPEGRSRSVGE